MKKVNLNHQNIIRLLNEHTVKEVAELTGYSEGGVRKVAKDNNVVIVTESDLRGQEVLSLNKEGISVLEIAEKVNLSPARVYQIIAKELGPHYKARINAEKVAERRNERLAQYRKDTEDIRTLTEQGRNPYQISQELGLTRAAVVSMAEKEGISLVKGKQGTRIPYTYNGVEYKSIRDAAKKLGINYNTFMYQVNKQ